MSIAAPAELGLAHRAGLRVFESMPAEGDRAGTEFYVPAYMGPPETLQVMREMPHLRVVQLLTAGYENALADLPPGVTLCNAAGVHDASTAELAVGLMIASLRGIDDFARAMPQGQWLRGRRECLADRRVVVIGAGGVGQAIRRRLEAFEAHVDMVGRTAREGVHAMSGLPALLADADVVVLALPLGPSTHHLVDGAFLGRMKSGSLIVNVARGAVVDTDALLAEVVDGRLRAALDVTDPEPLPSDHPLWTAPGVLVSPHVGGNSSAFVPRARRLVEAQLARWQEGRDLEHVVALGAS